MFWGVMACVLCEEASDAAVCSPCQRTLPRIPHACPRCARPMPRREVCGKCLRRPPAFDAAIAAYAYRFPTDVLITRSKYGGDAASLRFLGDALTQALREREVHADAIVPVPLAPARQRERGYNQAAELAKVPTAQLQWPLLLDLMRTRETEKQTELTLKARLRNVRGAFSALSLDRSLADKHIVLVDDVMTTGATLNEAAKALKDAGAVKVTVAVVGRAVPRATAPS